MKRIVKFGPQYGKPKGPRMPSTKPRASKVLGGSKMGGFKFADGGSINEAMRPSTPPDPAVEAAIRNAPAAAAARVAAMRRAAAAARAERAAEAKEAMKKPPVKKNKGGSISSASKRADGCATKGKTKGRFV